MTKRDYAREGTEMHMRRDEQGLDERLGVQETTRDVEGLISEFFAEWGDPTGEYGPVRSVCRGYVEWVAGRLRSEVEREASDHKETAVELEYLLSELERRDAALREAEWSGMTADRDGEPIHGACPLCGRFKELGHHDECSIGRALATGGDDAPRLCRDCDGPLMHVGPGYWTCGSAECPSHSKTRGVRATTEPEERDD